MNDDQFAKLAEILKPQPQTASMFMKIAISVSTTGIVMASAAFIAMQLTLVRIEVTIENMEDKISAFEEFTAAPRFSQDMARVLEKDIRKDVDHKDNELEKKVDRALEDIAELKETRKLNDKANTLRDEKIRDSGKVAEDLREDIEYLKETKSNKRN